MQSGRLPKERRYYTRMANAKGDKAKLLKFISDGDNILDVGAGNGVLENLVFEAFPNVYITSLDYNENTNLLFSDMKEKYGRQINVVSNDYFAYMKQEQNKTFDVIIFSSVIHEMISYPTTGTDRYDTSIINEIIRVAYNHLNPGGKIVIRDGVKPMVTPTVEVEFLDREMEQLSHLFQEQFKAFDVNINRLGHKAIMDMATFAEMAYTITWGKESFDREVQEYYTYFSIRDWQNLYEEMRKSMNIKNVYFDKYVQEGYKKNLRNKMLVRNRKTQRAIKCFPATNCIVVFEKYGV